MNLEQRRRIMQQIHNPEGDSPHPVSMPERRASVSEARLRLSAERLPGISPRAYYPLFLI